jgi:hypothetical protein
VAQGWNASSEKGLPPGQSLVISCEADTQTKLTWLKEGIKEYKECHWGEEGREGTRTSLAASLGRLKKRKVKGRKEEFRDPDIRNLARAGRSSIALTDVTVA